MNDIDGLKMVELVKKFKSSVLVFEGEKSGATFKSLKLDMQEIYTLHISQSKKFKGVEEYLKHIYNTFNCLSVKFTAALKMKLLPPDDAAIIDECIQIMLKCSDLTLAKLTPNK